MAAALMLVFASPAAAHHTRFHSYWQQQMSEQDKNWYRATARCESGNNHRINTGNGYYGSVQWLPSTWHAAGGSGMPHLAGRHEQAVRAVWWRNKAGRSQWPVCG